MIDPESVATIHLHRILGASPADDNRVRFCLWAPSIAQVSVWLPDSGRVERMISLDSGYHTVEIEGIRAGQNYLFRLDGGIDRPDPASRYQPAGVHGPSQVVTPEFPWSDQDWTGRDHEDYVIYELHVGTFTAAGTFAAATERLDELVQLGVTAIELMPVAQTAGRWNWGYDGVNLFAPNHNYGTPADLKRLIDQAHRYGLAVILDVVYNHLGPEGNYLADFGPYLSKQHTTPWGAAPNFDDPLDARQLRRFFVANSIYWLDEFHFDALRVDAIHSMIDHSQPHVIAEISSAIADWKAASGRPAAMIAESNVFDPEMLMPIDDGGIGFDAQWCDDFLHSIFAVLRPGEMLTPRQYRPGTDLERTLRCGYVYTGTMQQAPTRSTDEKKVDVRGLIYSIQNHDFIGNHPLGCRLHQLTSRDAQAAAAALLILSPAIPMIFMGEEFASEHPFRFFVDFGDAAIRDAVVQGRRDEYPQHDWASGLLPTDQRTFRESFIGELAVSDVKMWNWYQDLIRIRKQWRSIGLLDNRHFTERTDLESGLFCLEYKDQYNHAIVASRLNATPKSITAIEIPLAGPVILSSHPDEANMQPNHAVISLSSRESETGQRL